ncbi:MAG: TVP38/TMEM64 family protein [Candidatus Saccharimonadales bacterium]
MSKHVNWDSPHLGRLLLLIIAVAGFTVVTMIIVELTGGPTAFRSLIEGAGPWTPVVYVLLKASTYVIAPLSGVSVKLASGALFGVWEGLALSVAADALGSSLNYWIARTFGRKGVQKFAGKQSLSQVDRVASKVATWQILLIARQVLSFMYDFISYAAGLARFRFDQFLAVSTLGSIPISLVYALLGDAAVESSSVLRIMIGVFGAALIAAIIGYSYHRLQLRKLGVQPAIDDKLGE